MGVLKVQALHEIPVPDAADSRVPIDRLPALPDNRLPVPRQEGLPALPAIAPVVFVILLPEIRFGPDLLLDFPDPAIGLELGDLPDEEGQVSQKSVGKGESTSASGDSESG